MPVSNKRRKNGKPTKGSDKLKAQKGQRIEMTVQQRLAMKELQRLIKTHGVNEVREALKEETE